MDWFITSEDKKRAEYVRKKVGDFSQNDAYLKLKKKIICVKAMIDYLFLKKHNVSSENNKILELKDIAEKLIVEYQRNVTPNNKDSSIDNPGWSNRNYILDKEYENKITKLTKQVNNIENELPLKFKDKNIKSCNAAGGKRKTRRAKKNTRSRK